MAGRSDLVLSICLLHSPNALSLEPDPDLDTTFVTMVSPSSRFGRWFGSHEKPKNKRTLLLGPLHSPVHRSSPAELPSSTGKPLTLAPEGPRASPPPAGPAASLGDMFDADTEFDEHAEDVMALLRSKK